MTFYHVFSSWLSIKVKRPSCFLVMILYQTIFMFLFMFLFMFFFMFLSIFFSMFFFMFFSMFLFMFFFMFLFMTLYQMIFMFFFMFSLCFSSYFSSCFFLCFFLWFFIKWSSCFFFMTFYQKDNAKVEKISIFSSLDVKLKFLMNWVKLTQFSVESSCIKLKIWATQLWIELNSKCQLKTQLDDQFMCMLYINCSMYAKMLLFFYVYASFNASTTALLLSHFSTVCKLNIWVKHCYCFIDIDEIIHLFWQA